MSPWTAGQQAPLSFTVSKSLLKFTSIELVMLSNRLTLFLLTSPFAFNLSSISIFSKESLFASDGHSVGASALTSVFPNEYSGLISCRINWFDFFAVLGTLESLLQHHGISEQDRCPVWAHLSVRACAHAHAQWPAR